MCFAGTFQVKTYKFLSTLCDRDMIPKNRYRIEDDVSAGNYHFWCVDRTTNKIIDKTPQATDPPDQRIRDDPVYIPWCEEWQREQREYCIDNLYSACKCDGWDCDEWLEYIVETEDWQKRKCFRNSFALWKSDPERYSLVCGSFGWVIGETQNYILIGLDYGK